MEPYMQTVERKVSPYTYEVTFKSPTQAALDTHIALYMQRFHPAGYGTHVTRRWECDHDGAHFYCATMERSHSCD